MTLWWTVVLKILEANQNGEQEDKDENEYFSDS